MKMKKILISGLLLLVPISVSAQTIKSANYTYRYNLDSTAIIYCKVTGQNGSPFADAGARAGTARIKTVGSNVAVSAQTAGQNPFAAIAVNDIIIVKRPLGPDDVRVVATRTDADNITVDLAVDWSTNTTGFEFRWLQTTCGTTDADGWVEAGGGQRVKTVTFLLQQISGVVGGIDVRIECKGQSLGALPTPVYPVTATASCAPGTNASGFCNFTTAGITTGRFIVSIPRDTSCGQVRLGMLIHTSDAADTLETDKERITAFIEVDRSF